MSSQAHPLHVGNGYATSVKTIAESEGETQRQVARRLIRHGEERNFHKKPIDGEAKAKEAIQITKQMNDKLTRLKLDSDASSQKQVMHRLIYHGMKKNLHEKPL